MPYGLIPVLPPNGEPVTLTEARVQLRYDPDDTSQDSAILKAVRAARTEMENGTGRQLVSSIWQMDIDCFPGLWNNTTGPGFPGTAWGAGGFGYPGWAQGAGQWGWKWWQDYRTIRLPKPPFQFLNGITYIDP